MDYNKIKILLDKYMDGESSLTEEQQLKAYFQEAENIPQEFVYAKTMFTQFKQEKEVSYSTPQKDKSKKRFLLKTSGIAASIALVVGIALFHPNNNDQAIYGYINGKPITDKSIAIDEIQSALNMVSQNYNRGTKELNQLSKFYKTTEKVMNCKW